MHSRAVDAAISRIREWVDPWSIVSLDSRLNGAVSWTKGASPLARELRAAEFGQAGDELVPGQDGQAGRLLKDGHEYAARGGWPARRWPHSRRCGPGVASVPGRGGARRQPPLGRPRTARRTARGRAARVGPYCSHAVRGGVTAGPRLSAHSDLPVAAQRTPRLQPFLVIGVGHAPWCRGPARSRTPGPCRTGSPRSPARPCPCPSALLGSE